MSGGARTGVGPNGLNGAGAAGAGAAGAGAALHANLETRMPRLDLCVPVGVCAGAGAWGACVMCDVSPPSNRALPPPLSILCVAPALPDWLCFFGVPGASGAGLAGAAAGLSGAAAGFCGAAAGFCAAATERGPAARRQMSPSDLE